MESHHASLGRRTLEEIRQKRAAERLSKAPSVGSDLPTSVPYGGLVRSESEIRLSEVDIHGLVSQIKELERKNAALGEENKNLASKLRTKEEENDAMQRRLNDLEQSTVPSLRKALRDVAMEKDAAIVAREDLSTQLRLAKKRLKEAEEEQYRTEEQAEALRAELNSLQQQAMMNPTGIISPMGSSPDHIQALETDIANLKSELQQESLLRQQEQQRLAEVQAQSSILMAEKQVLDEKLEALTRNASEASDEAASKAFSLQEKEKLERQLHDMAVVVEKLENSRQKLLLEIDSQSLEIERLFEENSNLSTSYEDAMGVVGQWENKVNDCLKQNEDLRALLGQLRAEQANNLISNEASTASSYGPTKSSGEAQTAETLLLKAQLSNEQSRAEELSAEVMKLSAQLQQSVQAYNSLSRLYKPVLRNIESSLIKMKQDGSVSVQ
ncbi:testis-specific gene 10 protein-like [Papaver somniferum]|uniref:testis-specific gene 10 protein-like n=1 Tax=Papaver somniferum TaxID=3469 RepID=UPI000E6FD52A|nr:testis-specific gene 10 protein-like [Papaver somniferum]